MKEWHLATFMKEKVKALDERRILAPANLKKIVSFPRYGRLKLEFVLEQISYEQIYKGLNSSVSLYMFKYEMNTPHNICQTTQEARGTS